MHFYKLIRSTVNTFCAYDLIITDIFAKRRTKLSWCKEIIVDVTDERVRRLINGYVLFDLLHWGGRLVLIKLKMWQLFEDLVRGDPA